MNEAVAEGLVWPQLTRLGEAQILLPAMLLALVWLVLQADGRRLALAWGLSTAAAALLTTATKVAFLGFGVGWAALDFTGISGHAMFAAAVIPPLLRLAVGPRTQVGRAAVLAMAYVLAAAVAVSRVEVGAHSWSEVLAGFTTGAVASGLALGAGHWPGLRLARWAPALLLAWALLGGAGAPPSRTHDLVTRLSLSLSGQVQPFTRQGLHRQQPQAPSLPSG